LSAVAVGALPSRAAVAVLAAYCLAALPSQRRHTASPSAKAELGLLAATTQQPQTATTARTVLLSASPLLEAAAEPLTTRLERTEARAEEPVVRPELYEAAVLAPQVKATTAAIAPLEDLTTTVLLAAAAEPVKLAVAVSIRQGREPAAMEATGSHQALAAPLLITLAAAEAASALRDSLPVQAVLVVVATGPVPQHRDRMEQMVSGAAVAAGDSTQSCALAGLAATAS
jgi:hypothetical protein